MFDPYEKSDRIKILSGTFAGIGGLVIKEKNV